MSEFYKRLQAQRAQQFAQRDADNAALWETLQQLPANIREFGMRTENPQVTAWRLNRAQQREGQADSAANLLLANQMNQAQMNEAVTDNAAFARQMNQAQVDEAMADNYGLMPGQTGVPQLDAPLSQMSDNQMKAAIMQGVIPPALNKSRIPAQVAQAQQAARTGDDLQSFSSERNLPKDAQAKVQKQYETEIDKYMKQREKLIENMQSRAKIIRESESGINLAPLLALVDSETGSNFSRGYQAPLNAAQKERLAQNLEARASQGLGALANIKQQQRNQALLNDKWKRDNMIRQKIAQIRSGQKPMSGEQLKRLDYVIGAEDALDRLTTAVNDPNVTMRPDIPFVGDNTFTEALRDAAENYGRMQSGGAINKDEEKRFLAKVYKMGDKRQDVLRKIKQFRREMQGRRTRLLSGGRDLGESKTAPQLDAALFDVDSFLGI